MDSKKTKYILRLDNNVLKPFDREGVQNLLEMGAFHQKDYIFLVETREWLRPFDMTGVFKLPELLTEQEFEKPEFMPPPEPKKKIFSEEVENLKAEVSKYQHELNNKVAVIQAIKYTRDDLEEDFQKIAAEKIELEEKILDFESEIQTLRTDLVDANLKKDEFYFQIGNLEKQVDDLLNIKDELVSLKGDLGEKHIELQNQLNLKELSFESFKAENLAMEARIEDLFVENEKLKKKQSIYLDFVRNEKKRADSSESSVSKLSQGIVKLKSLRKRDQIAIQNLENYKRTQSNKEARELDRLIGDAFEIDNSAHWFIESEGDVKGPFCFHDIHSLLKYEKVNLETPVKKGHDQFWTTIGNDFELSAELITHSEIKDGREVFRYFINRTNYRAPFHGTAVIEIDGFDLPGFCTSLSVGGAFIELPSLPVDQTQGTEATLRISAGALTEELTLKVTLRNFSVDMPCGIGVQFTELDDEQRNIIMSYVSSYLEDTKKTG